MNKEVCIFNYARDGAIYGIGTYIKEYVYCLKNIGCKIIIIELGTDKTKIQFQIKEEGCVRSLYIPYPLIGDFDRFNKIDRLNL